MAGIIKRGNRYYVQWKQDGKTIQRAAGVRVKQAGVSPRDLARLARETADKMERVAKGLTIEREAVDALRKSARASGCGLEMPSVERWLFGYVETSAPKTRANRKKAFERFLLFLGGNRGMRLDAVTQQHMRGFFTREIERVSAGTVRQYKAYLAAAFNRAVDEDVLLKSPMPRNLKLEQLAAAVNGSGVVDKVKRLPFTRDELRLIFERFPFPLSDLAFLSFATGGQRLGDCCCLKWESVDWGRNLVIFEG